MNWHQRLVDTADFSGQRFEPEDVRFSGQVLLGEEVWAVRLRQRDAVAAVVQPDVLGQAVNVDHEILLAGKRGAGRDDAHEPLVSERIRQRAAGLEVAGLVPDQERLLRRYRRGTLIRQISDGFQVNPNGYDLPGYEAEAFQASPAQGFLILSPHAPLREGRIQTAINPLPIPPAPGAQDVANVQRVCAGRDVPPDLPAYPHTKAPDS